MAIPTLDPFQVIADPSRRQMLELLMQDRHTINRLAENFSMSRPAVSKHIRILNEAGFITIEDVGRERYCSLNKEGFDTIQQWIRHFDGFWAGNLGKLEKLLKQKSKK
ncbi:MAG: ArsR/SmtB family transcription factor [Flavisolibacter sp.]